MGKRYNVQQFKKKPEKTYLVEENKESYNLKNDNEDLTKNKVGRKRKGEELINKRFSLAFTESEYNEVLEKAGKIPISAFIRDALKDSGIIK